MKATINGITVEGTPQEIAEVMKIANEWKRQSVIKDVGRIAGKCDRVVCYCDGSCKVKTFTTSGDGVKMDNDEAMKYMYNSLTSHLAKSSKTKQLGCMYTYGY